jgi:hypothetical protein
MFPAAIVPPSVQAWLVYGLCGIGLVAVLLGLLYLLHLFAKRFQLPWAQLTALATITALPLIPIFHLSPIVDVVIIGTGVLHPIVSILLLLVLVLIAWQATRSLSAFVRNEVLSRRRKFLALGIIFSIALGTVATGPALAVMMSDTIEERTWISPTVWPQAARVHTRYARTRHERASSDLRIDCSQ